MLKRTALSIMIIVLVAMLVGLGTYAYFSDTEVTTGNVAQAGTIDISVNGENPWASSMTIRDLKPCQVQYMSEQVQNVGENPVILYKKITVTGTFGGVHPESEWNEDPDDTINNIDTVTRYDLYANGIPIIPDDPTNPPISFWSGRYIRLGQLDPGQIMDVRQSFHMYDDVTNWAQGDVMTFDVEFLATQLNAPAP